jgi:hypothetical protein
MDHSLHTTVAPRPGKPFQPGKVIGKIPAGSLNNAESPYLTPLEQQIAVKLGVTAEQLPALKGSAAVQRLSKELAARGSTVSSEELTRLRPAAPLVLPPERDISEISMAEQAEITSMLADYQRVEATHAAVPPALAATPGMAETFRAANQTEPSGIEIFDAVPDPTAFSPLKRPTVTAPVPPAIPPKAELADDVGAKIEQTSCQHCGQDLRRQAPEVSPTDKATYLQEVVIAGKRFRKDFLLFAGKMRVVFRSLLPHESDWARRQAEKDFAAGRIFSGLGYTEKVLDYRLVMSIESIERVSGEPLIFEAAIDLPVPKDEPTPLAQLLEYFNSRVFNTDTIKRAIGQKCSQFTQLSEYLETQSGNSDFWSATESAS